MQPEKEKILQILKNSDCKWIGQDDRVIELFERYAEENSTAFNKSVVPAANEQTDISKRRRVKVYNFFQSFNPLKRQVLHAYKLWPDFFKPVYPLARKALQI